MAHTLTVAKDCAISPAMPIVLDDSELRYAAMALVCAAKRVIPKVAFGVHAIETGSATLLVEVAIGAAGPREVTLLLDSGGPTQSILAEIRQPGEPVRDAA